MSEVMTSYRIVTHHDDGAGQPAPALLWQFATPMRAISSAVLGGGIGDASWIVNAHVRLDYDCSDPVAHLKGIARGLELDPDRGVGLLTAARVEDVASAVDGGVRCDATVGLSVPTWAAAPDPDSDPEPGAHEDPAPASTDANDCVESQNSADNCETSQRFGLLDRSALTRWRPGTINLVCQLPVPLTDAALAGAVITATEAKTQALIEAGVPGTGTASDAVVICCPDPHSPAGTGSGANGVIPDPFAGPRSRWGSKLARAVHEAVATGTAGYVARHAPEQ